MATDKRYLGDSVYVRYLHGMVTLTTENGRGPSNTIHLEAETTEQLLKFLVDIYGRDAVERCLPSKER